MTARYFIFGAGYSGKAFARARGGAAVCIAGTTRSADKFELLRAAGIEPYLFNGETLSRETVEALARSTHLVVSAAPEESGDPVLRLVGGTIRDRMPKLGWIGYLSTVGVYGDFGGAWVDESAPCRPRSRRSVLRLEAEHGWLALGEELGVPVAVLRLSGIYGPGRNAFANLAAGTARRLVKPGQVFNRIGVDDIAGALWHLSSSGTRGVFNVTDDLPAPPQDVVSYAAQKMGVDPPPETSFEGAEISPMQRSFYSENKRVSNAALRQSGYHLRYPDYRAGLDALWTSDNWRGDADADRRTAIKRS